jgi:outer membrane protein OmpA-like peptidoglycan-associated protein
MLRTSEGIIEFASHSLGTELAEKSSEKIRVLCEPAVKKCRPIRYELSPLLEETNVADWTLKSIPKYVTKGEYSFNPQATPDGNLLFWTTLTRIEGTSRSTQKIWMAEKDEFGFWKPGRQLEKPLNNQMPSAVISVLPGGNEIFVFGNFGEDEMIRSLKTEMDAKSNELLKTTNNRKEFEYKLQKLKDEYRRKAETIYNRAPLYKSQKSTASWTNPKLIEFPSFYNSYRKPENPNQQIFGGSTLSSSGKILIYSAQQKTNYGKLDLYVSFMGSDGVFQEGLNLGNMINTSEEEMAPFLGSDDRTLYFSSNGHDKEISIYVSKRVGDGWRNWTRPKEISTNLRGVNFFSIPPKSEWAFVSRDGELFYAKIPAEFRPNPVVLVQGKVLDMEGKPLGVELRYESLDKKTIRGSGISDPISGGFSMILPYGENYGFFAEKEGYLPVSLNIDLRNPDQILKSTDGTERLTGADFETKETIIKLPKLEKGQEIVLNNLFFETGSAEIAQESESELLRIAAVLKKSPKLKVLLEGHTDSIGKKDSNYSLSLARANAVRDYLIQTGEIPKDQIETVGLGADKPVADNTSESGRSKNRRVVFRIKDESK